MKRFFKYTFFLLIIFGGLAVTFIQAGGTVLNLINIEDGNIDVSDGNIRLDSIWPYNCDSDLWFCEEEKVEICESDFPEEDYIVVAKTDYDPGTGYQWKTEQTDCREPYCVNLVLTGSGWVLTNDNEVDFSDYPARNACKSYGEGARLPTEDELDCIYANRSDFEDEQEFASAYYWSATEVSEDLARSINFSDGYTHNYYKTVTNRVRCVRGY